MKISGWGDVKSTLQCFKKANKAKYLTANRLSFSILFFYPFRGPVRIVLSIVMGNTYYGWYFVGRIETQWVKIGSG